MTSEPDGERLSPRKRWGIGAAIVLVLAALTVTVTIGVIRGALTPVQAVQIEDAISAGGAQGRASVTSGEVFVHVSGAVTTPGLYVLDEGARVVDAVAAAGGFADRADEGAVNLARLLSDGEQLVVPVQGEAPTAAPGEQAAGDGKVNLNTADLVALDTLPRIGPAMAERIIQWRDANGRFTSIEDLLAVPGIGDKMLETLRDLVTI